MGPGDLIYIALAINPIGGLALAIPYAVIKLRYPAWLVLLTGIPLAYVQVVAVDLGWTTLARWPRLWSFIERRRSERLERRAVADHGRHAPCAGAAAPDHRPDPAGDLGYGRGHHDALSLRPGLLSWISSGPLNKAAEGS